MSEAVIRPAGPGDREAIGRVVADAFGDEGRQRDINAVIEALRREDHMRHELVADHQGEVVGYVGLSRGWLDARPQLVEVDVLSPLAVLPARHGAGAGTALLQSALAAAEAAGTPLVFLEGSPGYYASRGFRPAAEVGLTAPSARIPAPACQVALLTAHEPWMRGALVYPDVWWRHDLVGLRDPLLAELEEKFSG